MSTAPHLVVHDGRLYLVRGLSMSESEAIQDLTKAVRELVAKVQQNNLETNHLFGALTDIKDILFDRLDQLSKAVRSA